MTLKNTMDTDLFLQFVSLNVKFSFLKEYIIGFRLHRKSKTVESGRKIGPIETKCLFEKYNPYNKIIDYFSPVFKILWALFFVYQGDIDYLIKRIFVEKQNNYDDYDL